MSSSCEAHCIGTDIWFLMAGSNERKKKIYFAGVNNYELRPKVQAYMEPAFQFAS